MARVPYLTPETARGQAAEVLGGVAARGLRTPILSAVAHSTGGFRNFARLGNSLIQYTALPDRLRELAILHLAAAMTNPYEWIHHEAYARAAGVTDAEFAALRAGSLAGLSETERAVLAFTDAVVERRVSGAEVAALGGRLGSTEAIVDLVLIAAWWGGMVPRVVEALDLEPTLPEV